MWFYHIGQSGPIGMSSWDFIYIIDLFQKERKSGKKDIQVYSKIIISCDNNQLNQNS